MEHEKQGEAQTAATVLSGFSTTFTQLLITRGGTAAAESGLVPAGFSIFADTLTPRKVPRASAILMLAPFIGGGTALLAGGAALAHFSVAGAHSWLFQKLLPWQMVYVVIGLPGIVLVALLLMVREPVRRELGTMRDVGAEPAPTPRQVCKFLFSDSQFFAPYIAGMCIVLLLFYSQLAWFPAFLSRQFDAPAASVGKLLGPVFMLAGITGTLSSQLFLRRLANDSVVPRIVSVITWAIGVQLLLALAIPLLPDLRAGVALYGVSTFLTSIITSIMNVPLQLSVPNRMRGQTIGIAVFGASLFGTGAGPFLVGFLNDHAFSGRASLGLSLALVAGAAATTATVLMIRARTVYGRPRGLGAVMKSRSGI